MPLIDAENNGETKQLDNNCVLPKLFIFIAGNPHKWDMNGRKCSWSYRLIKNDRALLEIDSDF